MPKRKDSAMTEQPDEITPPDTDSEEQPDTDPEVEPEAPVIPHHPDLIDDYDRHDYIAVDGQTLVAQFKFSDGSGIKAWTRDQAKLYATRHITARGHAVLASGQARVGVDEVNAEILALAAEREATDD